MHAANVIIPREFHTEIETSGLAQGKSPKKIETSWILLCPFNECELTMNSDSLIIPSPSVSNSCMCHKF